MATISIQVVQAGHTPMSIALRAAPLLIGRGPGNDVVVTDDQVSWHHAAVWLEASQVWVRDLGSKNGIVCAGHRVRGAQPLNAGDAVSLGTAVTLTVISDDEGSRRSSPSLQAYLVEDCASGLQLAVRGNRFHIGAAVDADLRWTDAPDRAATILFYGDGEVWLGTEESEQPIALDREFQVVGRTLRVVRADASMVPTADTSLNVLPYTLSARLDGPTGPEAALHDPRLDRSYVVQADNRAVLLYVLARQRLDDLQSGLDPDEAGWCADEDVVVGIWGKQRTTDANGLHVLVYRVRKEIGSAGFDPWFIEKRRRAIRVSLIDVAIR